MAFPNTYLHLLCMVLVFPGPAFSQNYSETDRLLTDLLTGYNTQVRPMNNQSLPLVVNVSVNVFQLTEVDVVKGMISLTVMAIMTWYDERIVWNPAEYGGINTILVRQDSVWVPNLACASPYSEVDEVGEPWMKVRLFPNGYANYHPGDIVESSCSYDVSYWPFDTQDCNVSFMAFGYLESEVDLNIAYDGVSFVQYIKHGEWDIVGSSALDTDFLGMDYIRYTIQLQRRSSFFIANIIMPIVGIMVLNPMVFLLPSESGERVGYAITVLLSIAVFFSVISDNLPTSSTPMAKIISFILVGLGSSMVISIAVILNLRLYHRTDKRLPAWAIFLVRLSKGRCRPKTKVDIRVMESTDCQVCNGKDTGRISDDINDEKQRAYYTKCDQQPTEYCWKDVSAAVDRLLFLAFCLLIVVTTVTYMAALTTADR